MKARLTLYLADGYLGGGEDIAPNGSDSYLRQRCWHGSLGSKSVGCEVLFTKYTAFARPIGRDTQVFIIAGGGFKLMSE